MEIQVESVFRTEKNYSRVIKIDNNKYACLDLNGRIYRICENLNELIDVEPYMVDVDLTYLINSDISNKKELDKVKLEKSNIVSDFNILALNANRAINLAKLPDYSKCNTVSSILKVEADLNEKARILKEKNNILDLKCLAKKCKISYEQLLFVKQNFKPYMYSTDHKMGCYTKVFINDILIDYNDSRTTYSGRGKNYSASHGISTINLTSKDVKKMQLIGGVVTIIESKVDKHITKVKIFKPIGGFVGGLDIKDMYLTSTFHGETINDCKKWREKEAVRLLKIRNDNKNLNELLQKSKFKFIGLHHSLDVGNCETGTNSFAQRHKLNIDFGYNLNYLLQLEPNNYYLNKILYSI